MAGLSGSGALIKGFVTLSGVSGASVGGWYVYSNATAEVVSNKTKTPSPENSSSPQVLNKNLNIDNNFSPKLSECFGQEVFFKDASLNKISVENVKDTEISDDDLKKIEDSTTDPKPSAQGCTVVKNTKVKDKEEWTFESKTLIKKDKIGMAVLLEVNESSQRYQVYWLKKGDTDSWSVEFGIISNEVNEIKSLGSPDSSTGKLTHANNKWSNAITGNEYSGSWETKTDGSEDLLFDGIKDLKTKFQSKYIYKDNELIKEKNPSKDRKEVLKKWFEPFEKVKGAWTKKANSTEP